MTECKLCPHHCNIAEGKSGLCLARANVSGNIVCTAYGRLTAAALDPIEKKPLYHFFPGSMIFSIGSYGCNMRCPFCQNYDISTTKDIDTEKVTPEQVVNIAISLIPRGNIGISFTYNEMLTNYEFVVETSRLARNNNLKTVIVTNGMITEEYLKPLLPLIDAMNIDLKCFSESGYRKLGGDLQTVLETIRLGAASCHVEVTTLIVPGFSDDEETMKGISKFIAEINKDIPLHITRYFPHYNYDSPATDISVMRRLAIIASEKLTFVHLGNI